jgi:hypothetical protein
MAVVEEREHMARKKKNDPRGETTTTRVFERLLQKARMVSLHRGMDLLDFLDGILRPVVDREYEKMRRELAKEDDQ